ncbi:MAG: hypothetical protein ACFCUJ_10515 [Thiotrichales bacterium]
MTDTLNFLARVAPRVLGAVACVMAINGCAMFQTVESGIEQLDRKVSTAMKKRGLQPKVEQIATIDEIWESADCANRRLPYLKLTRHDMFPAEIVAGATVNHRFEYTLCLRGNDRPIIGDLTRRIYFGGKPVLTDTSSNVELKPGHWVVDAFITVPEQAPPGSYEMEVKFDSIRAPFRDRPRLEIAKP